MSRWKEQRRKKRQEQFQPAVEGTDFTTVDARKLGRTTITLAEAPDTMLSPLGYFGGLDEFKKYVSTVWSAAQQPNTTITAYCVEGISLHPYGLPSTYVGPDGDSARIKGEELMFSAIMREGNVAFGSVYDGKEAVPYVRDFLDKAIEVASPEMTIDQINELRAILGGQANGDANI